MMKNLTKNLAFAAPFLLAGFGLIFVLSGRLDHQRPVLPDGYEDQDLSLQGKRLKGYALGFEGLIADWYWMQSLQYIGKKVLASPRENISIENLNNLNPRLLHPYLDNATTLDPKFMAPYYYGALVLPAIDKEKAIQITEKGIAENPHDWRLFQYLGYIHWRLGNYEKAAEVYQKGSQIAGAPKFFQLMVAQMKSQGGSRETARAIYRQMFDEAESEQTRKMAEIRLLELHSFDERDIIRGILEKFKTQNNRCPSAWREIFPLLRTVKAPNGREFLIDQKDNLLDPTGAPYVLDQTACEIRIDFGLSKLPS